MSDRWGIFSEEVWGRLQEELYFIKEGGKSECWGSLFFLPLMQPSGLPHSEEECRKEAWSVQSCGAAVKTWARAVLELLFITLRGFSAFSLLFIHNYRVEVPEAIWRCWNRLHTEADTRIPFLFEPDLWGLQKDAAVTRPIYFVLKRILLLIWYKWVW